MSSTTSVSHPILTAFGLAGHSAAFMKAIYSTDTFISGDAALYWSLILQDPTVSVPDDLDIDIWMPKSSKADYSDYFHNLVLDHFEVVLEMAGYFRQTGYINSRSCGGMITKIQTFIHPKLGRKIRIIAVDAPTIIDIVNTFNLNMCKATLCACSRYNKVGGIDYYLASVPVVSEYKTNIFKRVMTLSNVAGNDLASVLALVEKYYARGWAFETDAPHCVHCGHSTGGKIRLTLENAKEMVVKAVGPSPAGASSGTA